MASMGGCADRGRGLLLLLYLALAAVGVTASTHLEEIANDALKNCADSCEKEDQAHPVVPYIRCNHDCQRSQTETIRRYCQGLVVGGVLVAGALVWLVSGGEFISEAFLEAVEETLGQFLALSFSANSFFVDGMKFVGLCAV